jgi:hypothetical protein
MARRRRVKNVTVCTGFRLHTRRIFRLVGPTGISTPIGAAEAPTVQQRVYGACAVVSSALLQPHPRLPPELWSAKLPGASLSASPPFLRGRFPVAIGAQSRVQSLYNYFAASLGLGKQPPRQDRVISCTGGEGSKGFAIIMTATAMPTSNFHERLTTTSRRKASSQCCHNVAAKLVKHAGEGNNSSCYGTERASAVSGML